MILYAKELVDLSCFCCIYLKLQRFTAIYMTSLTFLRPFRFTRAIALALASALAKLFTRAIDRPREKVFRPRRSKTIL